MIFATRSPTHRAAVMDADGSRNSIRVSQSPFAPSEESSVGTEWSVFPVLSCRGSTGEVDQSWAGKSRQAGPNVDNNGGLDM